jgi:hypothetical protein
MVSEADIKNFLLRAQPSDAAAVPFLQLCEVSYLPQAEIKPTVDDPNTLLPPTPGGQWRCVWGPAQDDDTANLAFVALYHADPNAAPLFCAVTIRGTDVNIDNAWGVITELWEDIDVLDRHALPWAPDDPARIASGTREALDAFEALTQNGQTLSDYLLSLVRAPANRGMPIAVVGHSLGGCMASVVAPWLRQKLGNEVPITPVTFAAPTAGNQDFVAYFQRQFPNALRYWNSLDIVPRGWYDIGGVKTLYALGNLGCPDIVRCAIDGFELAMTAGDVAYRQPDITALELTAAFATPTTDWTWYDEAGFHHHATTYMQLLGGSDVVGTYMWKPAALRGKGPSRIMRKMRV